MVQSTHKAQFHVTREGGFEGFESPDGKFLFYVKGREIPGIWRVPVAGGDEIPLSDRDHVGYWRCWRVARGGVYFATAAPPGEPRLEFLNLATGAVEKIATLARPPDATIPGLAVSPDGHALLVAQYDQNGSNIIMVERAR